MTLQYSQNVSPDDIAHMMIVTWMVFFKSVFMLGVACHAKYFIAKNVAREFDTFSGLTGAMTRIKRLHTLSSYSHCTILLLAP